MAILEFQYYLWFSLVLGRGRNEANSVASLCRNRPLFQAWGFVKRALSDNRPTSGRSYGFVCLFMLSGFMSSLNRNRAGTNGSVLLVGID